jgi:hypothetical protein
MTSDLAKSLAVQRGVTWGEHPEYVVSDWQYSVANGDTRLGYWDWVAARLDEDNRV